MRGCRKVDGVAQRRYALHIAVVMTAASLMFSCGVARATPSEVEAQLNVAEAKWKRASPAQYQFVFRYSAMFHYVGCESGRFQVRVVNGLPKELSDCKSVKNSFATVPRLFKYLRGVLAREPDTIEVSFDPTLGYPIRLEVDYSKQISDDYFTFEISDFAAANPR
jgi:hypothetical protein